MSHLWVDPVTNGFGDVMEFQPMDGDMSVSTTLPIKYDEEILPPQSESTFFS